VESGRDRHAPDPRARRSVRIVVTVAIVFVVVLALVALFMVGTRLRDEPQASAPAAPAPSSTPRLTATPAPTPTIMPKPSVAQQPGVRAWNTLGGGECLQPYTGPWADTFTVVDCATGHAAQMVYTALLSTDPAEPYPGAGALAQSTGPLCSQPGVISMTAAAAYPDLQVQASYPATAGQWTGGDRSYYCFASRTSGQPMTGSIAGPGPAS
jgi:hypothetical protein